MDSIVSLYGAQTRILGFTDDPFLTYQLTSISNISVPCMAVEDRFLQKSCSMEDCAIVCCAVIRLLLFLRLDMLLEGSCHCNGVRFKVWSAHPYPFNRCYCSICRKTSGGGGYAINLGGDFSSLEIEGEPNVSEYSAIIQDEKSGKSEKSPAQRNFCKLCGSALWIWDPRWPQLVHPHASAIDSELPVPPEHTHLMVGSKAPWVELCEDPNDKVFDLYPDESIAAWHKRLGLQDIDQ